MRGGRRCSPGTRTRREAGRELPRGCRPRHGAARLHALRAAHRLRRVRAGATGRDDDAWSVRVVLQRKATAEVAGRQGRGREAAGLLPGLYREEGRPVMADEKMTADEAREA